MHDDLQMKQQSLVALATKSLASDVKTKSMINFAGSRRNSGIADKNLSDRIRESYRDRL